jgi:uncharacterized protein with NRDE domain
MCLIVFAHQLSTDYPLVMVANRDEFRQRVTQNMFWWPNIDILAGKDLEAGGTWLALHKDGRWAAVTNFRRGFKSPNPALYSRGHLALDFLSQKGAALAFAQTVPNTKLAGFNLLLWDNNELVFCSNEEHTEPTVLGPGLYALSNGTLDSDWPKMKHVKGQLEGSLSQPPQHSQLQTIMQHKIPAPDHLLPQTGIPIDWERRLSACFIDAPEYNYGTRSCISLWRDQWGSIDVQETCFDTPTPIQQNFNWTHKTPCTTA